MKFPKLSAVALMSLAVACETDETNYMELTRDTISQIAKMKAAGKCVKTDSKAVPFVKEESTILECRGEGVRTEINRELRWDVLMKNENGFPEKTRVMLYDIDAEWGSVTLFGGRKWLGCSFRKRIVGLGDILQKVPEKECNELKSQMNHLIND